MTRRPSFGINVDPLAERPGRAAELARAADEGGLDYVAIQDHPYMRGFLDAWTLLATLVPQTTRVAFFPDVSNLPLRPPAMLAKAAASLDVLSGGRVELGLGAGGYQDAIAAMGGPRRSPAQAVAALSEAIDVIRLVWGDERAVRYQGRFYHLTGLHPGPRPPHPIGIWLGGGRPRMLALTGSKADGWVPSSGWAPPERLPDLNRLIDEAAAAAGRDPGAIQRVYNVMGLIGGAGDGPFQGPVAAWVERLASLFTGGQADTFVYWPLEDHFRQARQFAGEVVPAVREAVGQAPG
ncbi:MAG TPA: LLM class flavin-dependent oxidoreductase [Actinomycetota bacterium]|jgi:alkanesulfonate monooxygenase SsuD/methylene tetrahydromethanopterin reductase-like flavin-dependent oxidoreductase (luciferase family)|nr:LLM class flavin-dependent oxidoreductase [Actinomycetota bacterium]